MKHLAATKKEEGGEGRTLRVTEFSPSNLAKNFSGSRSYLPNSLTMSPHTYE